MQITGNNTHAMKQQVSSKKRNTTNITAINEITLML